MSLLTARVQRIKPSATIAVAAKAAELKAQGKDIISLGLGEPDFDTPLHIIDAAEKAMRSGLTHYTQVDGLPSLKAAIQAKFKNENDLEFQLNEILVSSGAKHSIYNLLQAFIPADIYIRFYTGWFYSLPVFVFLVYVNKGSIDLGELFFIND